VESTGMGLDSTGFHRNNRIPAGMEPESTGIGFNYLIPEEHPYIIIILLLFFNLICLYFYI
jgi:hypothetical protein